MKGFAIHNAPTTHGGIIPATQMRSSQMGNLFVCAGDGHFCPLCRVWSVVQPSHNHVIFDGKPVAYVGDMLSCGAQILQQQSHVVGDAGGGSLGSSNRSSLQPTNTQKNLTNSFTENRKFENYYIERNKTDYVKFKAVLTPYDEDKKGLLGLFAQVGSGACDFIVTYILKEKNLFVTVSYVPPVVKHDANKIIPFTTLRLYKENSRKFELLGTHKLKLDSGLWNTEQGKEPVGFVNITLPKPDLSPLKVELEMGYEAIFDGGKVVPIPSFVKHSFTLNSAAREIK